MVRSTLEEDTITDFLLCASFPILSFELKNVSLSFSLDDDDNNNEGSNNNKGHHDED